jgi:acid phosphatase (class A)
MERVMRAMIDPERAAKALRGRRRFCVLTIVVTLSVLSATAVALSASVAMAQSAAVPEIRAGFLRGYLAPNALPNSLALIPSPPAAGSAALALDEEFSRRSLDLQGTPRWKLAAEDADLMFPHAAGTFSCSLNAPITEQDTPHLYTLMRRSLSDAALSTYAAKDHYKRARPFMVNKAPTCTPDKEARLRDDGSYPSGHTAIGWAWALILSEIAPDQMDAILARGRAYGQSRVVCNVHWESDVIEGRTVGAAAVARLHDDSTFLADLAAAKVELAAVRAEASVPARDCPSEAAELALDPPRAP